MKKVVRFLIGGFALLLGGLVANIAARTLTDGAISTTGSVLLDISLFAWLGGLVLLVIAIVLAVRAAWRWSSNKPATREPQP